MDRHEPRPAVVRAAVLLLVGHGGSQQRERRLPDEPPGVALGGRRKELHARARAARRHAYHVGRSERFEAPDQWQRWRRHDFVRQWRYVEQHPQPAHGAVLSRDDRQCVAVPPVRRAAGQLRDQRGQPLRRRRHRRARLLQHRRLRERDDRRGPAQSEHHVRRLLYGRVHAQRPRQPPEPRHLGAAQEL